MKRERGFTLIELLVVVGIVAVLIAILLPAGVRVQRYSQKVACSASLRDIGTRLQMYLNDSKSRLPAVNPVATMETATLIKAPSLPVLLEPYTGKSAASYRCRADRITGTELVTALSGMTTFHEIFGTSYLYNPGLGLLCAGVPIVSSKITELYKETHDRIPWVVDFDAFHDRKKTTGSANTLFLDAHVEAVTQDIVPPTT